MDMTEIARLLAGTDVGRGLSEDDLLTIAAAGKVRTAWEGDEILREGESGESMLLLLDGEARVSKADVNGRVRELASLGTGALIGEIALLEAVPRSATVKATKPVRYFEMDRAALASMLSDEDRAAVRLLFNLARVLARRQRATNDRLVALLVEASQRGSMPDTDRFIHDLVIDLEC